jgi:hypothetical protein
MSPARFVRKSPPGPTLLPARQSFGCQDNLWQQYALRNRSEGVIPLMSPDFQSVNINFNFHEMRKTKYTQHKRSDSFSSVTSVRNLYIFDKYSAS